MWKLPWRRTPSEDDRWRDASGFPVFLPQGIKAVLRRRVAKSSFGTVLRISVFCGIAGGVAALLVDLLPSPGAKHVALAALIGLFTAPLLLLQRHRNRKVIDGFMAELEGYCRRCGYDLRGTTSARCPECGQAIAADRTEPTRSDDTPLL
jgi:hypothetical protein